uniref:RNA-directed DNA polymerase homolog n=1 Tax=Nicotiana tabacum TaxID=4097 RepID=A0A1S4AGU0_TOBAC|nr:PREDICTED: RNA-directed DNA polymerase homolog [Nicotiana tabacum]XP_016475866.1 PREDICTED: RNA-directed DNA polymerase homolog [Nicotiana tabacum]
MRRKFNAAINEAVSEEVDKLLANGSIRESKYPQWVANVVMVKKKNRKWRICVDFTDLNKTCLKDSFSLPHIDQLIDVTAGHGLLSFLDAYSGYNQILVAGEDQEKSTFITHQGTYYYNVMSFGLKNAGATYQRLVTKMFKEQLCRTMEVYIDDMLVKSKKKEDHIDHLKEAFEIFKQYGMKLNPEK